MFDVKEGGKKFMIGQDVEATVNIRNTEQNVTISIFSQNLLVIG